jgi:hypothetical protein
VGVSVVIRETLSTLSSAGNDHPMSKQDPDEGSIRLWKLIDVPMTQQE